MSWLRHHIAWVWPAALVVGLALVVIIRVWSGWADRPMASLASETDGVVSGESDGLVAAARRIRALQSQSAATRQQLAALQNDSSTKRQQAATLDTMLASDRLTDCPDFLRRQTTVRALQNIIREAADATPSESPDQSRLNTAAAVARERLRTKLEAVRSQLADEVDDLETQAITLRQQLQLQTAELERLQRQAQRQLHGRASSPHPRPVC